MRRQGAPPAYIFLLHAELYLFFFTYLLSRRSCTAGPEANDKTRLLEENEERERILADSGSSEIKERLRKSPLWGVVANNIVFMAVPFTMPSTFSNAGTATCSY